MKFSEPKTGFSLPPYDELKIDSFDIYVKPSSTGGDGSREKPFGSIEEARDRIRSLRESGVSGRVSVKIESGFIRTKGIDFDSRDGGVTYYADNTVISGGVTLVKSDFRPVDGEMAQRLDESVRGKVLVASLKD